MLYKSNTNSMSDTVRHNQEYWRTKIKACLTQGMVGHGRLSEIIYLYLRISGRVIVCLRLHDLDMSDTGLEENLRLPGTCQIVL